MRAGFTPSAVDFWQYAFIMLMAVPWVVVNRKTIWVTRRPILHIFQVAFAATGVQFWVLGLAFVPIWQAIALSMLAPLFVVIGAKVSLGELVGTHRWVALLFGFSGGMIILAPWSETFSIQSFFPVLAAVCWASSSLFIKRLTRTEGPDTITFYMVLLLTPINGLFLLSAGSTGYSALFWFVAAGAGLFTAFAQYALATAYARADASFLQPFDQLKLPLNVLLGLLVFGFMPPGSMFVGSTLIIISSIYLLKAEHTKMNTQMSLLTESNNKNTTNS